MEENSSHIGSHGSPQVGELYRWCHLRAMVVVGGEAHLPFTIGNTVIFLLISLEKHGCGLLLAEHLYERVFEVPTVVHVKSSREVIATLSLCKHEDVTTLSSSTQLVDGIFPEVGRNTVSHITAETVYAHLCNPELHRINHRSPHILVVVVQVGHIKPVPRTWMNNRIGFLIMGVPVRVFFHPRMIPCSVVGHPVENDTHTVLMTNLCQMLEIVNSTEFRSNGFIIADTVGRVLAFLYTDRVDGHHPHDVHAQITDGINTVGHCIQ